MAGKATTSTIFIEHLSVICQQDAIAALEDGGIGSGDIVVLRGLGPKGGPGMGFASWFTAALSGTGLASEVAVLTDGQLSGLNRGLTIGQITPEAAAGGPISLVIDGDRITIDLDARSVHLDQDAEELDRRRRNWRPPQHGRERGWLAIYEQTVQSLAQGAVLGARHRPAAADPRPEHPEGM
ncbi:dihydroxy-acid dehydratase domain-containing protein [Saccharopolyspora hattusasensis]|uniref:dihydroxy-acid dehydratase domain-containing protein n=1 Tax=Saccharopolyspora hattusasensis TaxID=1128679 RepID=UPI003D9923F6